MTGVPGPVTLTTPGNVAVNWMMEPTLYADVPTGRGAVVFVTVGARRLITTFDTVGATKVSAASLPLMSLMVPPLRAIWPIPTAPVEESAASIGV